MILKYLELQGFKSFPDKTKVNFGKGLTAVVGPNGSGKSNISDAVRWVMGEQSTKTLRGNKMEDVIFSGTKFRKSQGFAEVSLTVDNTGRELAIDTDEVTITRRYDRSGESEYMINRSGVRLKDVQEMFMDTGLGKDGYSIVGQGKIAEIVQSKSNERREIFEEAAGISKFRYKKNESERSLSRAEENLLRLRDILSELEGRIAPLKEQSEKAMKFVELAQNKKTLEISIWNDTLNRSNQALKDHSDKVLVSQLSHEEIEAEIAECEQKVEQAFSKMQECNILAEKLRHDKENYEAGIAETNSKIAVCENNIEHTKQNIARLQNEIENHKQTGNSADAEIEAKKAEIKAFEEKVLQLENQITLKQQELLKQSGESDSFSVRERELSDEVNKLLVSESEAKMTIASSEINLNEILQTVAANQAECQEKSNQLEKYGIELKENVEFFESLKEKADELKNTYAGHEIKLKNRSEKLLKLKSDCDDARLALREKEQKIKLLTAMEQSLEGFAGSVKEVIKLKTRGVLKGVLGTVSQLISVKGEYATAIETALGGSMQNIVCEGENDAKAAIRVLKQENLGRATFLPLTSIKPMQFTVDGLERYAGYVGVADKLVSCEEKYKNIVATLLGRVVIVDDIDTAVLIAQKNNYKFKIVTLDGQVVNAGGSLTGGSKNRGQSFLSRKNDIDSLNSEREALQKSLTTNEAGMNELSQEVAKIQAEYTAVASEITTVNEDKIRCDSEIKRLNDVKLQATQAVAGMNNEINFKLARQKILENSKADAERKLLAFVQEIAVKSEELTHLRQSNVAASETKTAMVDEISELNINKITLQKDIEGTNAAIMEIERRKQQTGDLSQQLKDEIAGLEGKLGQIDSEITALKSDAEQKRNEIADVALRVSEVVKARQEHEASSTALHKEVREKQEKKEKVASEIARLNEKSIQLQQEYDDIISKLWSEYELTRSEAAAIAEPIENASRATSELNSIRNKIRSLGSVNVDAIEEYKEVSERYEFLSAQIKDAEKARSELLRLINELTLKMQEIFSENFVKINENFKRIFVELFGGGNAELKLTEPDNLLESGIEIFVEPPGKVIKNLVSLSGGEQAFVAIAIYFSILKVRPAPFCILDEIEAALDDVNVDKYAQYLRQIADKTQFIMITHRRGSMEAADVLYGVTMQDEGVSKLLQLNVSEIEENMTV